MWATYNEQFGNYEKEVCHLVGVGGHAAGRAES